MGCFLQEEKMENTPIYVLGFVLAFMGLSTLVMNHLVAQKIKSKK